MVPLIELVNKRPAMFYEAAEWIFSQMWWSGTFLFFGVTIIFLYSIIDSVILKIFSRGDIFFWFFIVDFNVFFVLDLWSDRKRSICILKHFITMEMNNKSQD
jgi:hypothetical protein